MSVYVVLNLLNELMKINACQAFYRLFAMSLINLILHEYERIFLYHITFNFSEI